MISEEVLRTVDFIDMDMGMEHCAFCFELYEEALDGYLGPDVKYDDLVKYYAEKNWEEYRVAIHAVKGASLLLGIVKLSNDAKMLEAAVKENNIAYIDEHHEEVLAEYIHVIDTLKALK